MFLFEKKPDSPQKDRIHSKIRISLSRLQKPNFLLVFYLFHKITHLNKTKTNRGIVILFRKISYIACMNVLSIDVERHCLLMILLLSVFFIFEIQEKRLLNEKFNNLANQSQILLISSLFMKLFSFSVSNEIVEISFTYIILILNSLFCCEIFFKMTRFQYGNFGKNCKLNTFHLFLLCI